MTSTESGIPPNKASKCWPQRSWVMDLLKQTRQLLSEVKQGICIPLPYTSGYWCRTAVATACCSDGSLFRRMLWDAPILQTSNCSLRPSFPSRRTWMERDGCSLGLFEWLHDFHLFEQTNPNPYPNPNLNWFMPNPNCNLTSIHMLPLNLVLHHCCVGLLVHLTHAGRTMVHWNDERALWLLWSVKVLVL